MSWGWYAELMRCFMPDNLNSSSTTALLNSVPEMKLYFNYFFSYKFSLHLYIWHANILQTIHTLVTYSYLETSIMTQKIINKAGNLKACFLWDWFSFNKFGKITHCCGNVLHSITFTQWSNQIYTYKNKMIFKIIHQLTRHLKYLNIYSLQNNILSITHLRLNITYLCPWLFRHCYQLHFMWTFLQLTGVVFLARFTIFYEHPYPI